MPNWCNNEVKVYGEPEELQKFADHVKGKKEYNDDRPFSFQSIIPVPNELIGTNSPPTIMTEEELAEYIKEQELNPKKVGLTYNPITQETSDRLIKQYGANNWYDWCNENWGTKWDCSLEDYVNEDDQVRYDFDTAWCPPEPIYQRLKELFPKLHISWFYREDGMQSAGFLE